MELTEGHRIGSYRVIRKLGEGGMGAVFLAVHEKIERQVALKVLHPRYSQNPLIGKRFLNEARVVNIVHHPGLVQISDFGQLDDGTAYIVMEYLDGESLTAYLARKGQRLRPLDAIFLGEQIAQPLLAAHRKKIVHRDLKPDNVMLSADPAIPGRKQVKLLDFGIAKVASEYQASGESELQTRAGVLMGTPTYMAPEQCRGATDVDDRADVYALGGMIYCMLTGQPPFVAQGVGALIEMQIYKTPRPLREIDPAIPEGLASLVHAMLAKAPTERPAMEAVAAELQRLGAQLADKARALPAAPRSGRPEGAGVWTRRLALGAIFSLIGLGMAGVLVYRGRGPGPGPVRDEAGTGGTVPAAGPAETRPACSPAGWCREGPPGLSSRLRVIFGTSARDVWAAGDQGALLHFDGQGQGQGQGWTSQPNLTLNKYSGIFGLGPGDVWVAGEQGTFLHYDGRTWVPAPASGDGYITSLWGSRPGDLWAVGKEGTLAHFDGSAWEPVRSGTRKSLYGIWGSGPKDIWVTGKEGTLLHYDGGAWSKARSGTEDTLKGIWGSGPQDIWAAGKEGALLHYDGAAWSRAPRQTRNDLSGVWGSGPRSVWAVGDQGTILHFDGTAWTASQSGVTTDLDDVWGVATGGQEADVWAVGISGTILHWQRRR